MTYEALSSLAEKAGFSFWAPLDIHTISLKPEVRDMCAANTCGMYGKSWSCPPGCGTLTECAQIIGQYSHGILVQTCGEIEDGFDYESMMEIEKQHKDHCRHMHDQLRKQNISTLALGAGCCNICAECTYPDAPCRFPERMVSSIEAYGMLVLEVCRANGLPYYYGSDKMAYTSCFLLR